tara:strand:+ start:242 stop:1336 length:1095 start_codon:yes stop_codon:yes gene_type:complete
MGGKNFWDFSQFSDDKSALELFANSIRSGLEFDGLGGPAFIAKVLTPPLPLSPNEVATFFSLGSSKEVEDSGAAAKKMTKFCFMGRIEKLHGPFLEDPCAPAYAADQTATFQLIHEHTKFFSESMSTDIPSVGDLVRVELEGGPNGAWDLQRGTYKGIYESSLRSTPGQSANNPGCDSIMELFGLESGIGFMGEMGEDSRDLEDLQPDFKELVEQLIANLEERGFETFIATTFRSVETQIQKYNEGKSEVKYGYHNFVDENGQPASQAVDLALKDIGWGPGPPSMALEDAVMDPQHIKAAEYFKALGEEANKLGLEWGGDWSSKDPLWAVDGMGWDPAHVELRGSPALTKAKAKKNAQTAGYPV